MLSAARTGAAAPTPAQRRPAIARGGAAVAAAALLAGLAAGPALADASSSSSPSPVAAPAALYGKGDPTYDGVWRQSLALTALASVKVTPSDTAVGWLTGQQCADGGWPSFRADTSAACTPAAEDSNATSVAIQALVALGGHQDAVDKGVRWLKTVQNSDGTWAYNPGTPGDADSTGLAVSALRAARIDPATVAKDGRNGLDGLAGLQLGCSTAADQRGAFAYQPATDGTLAANGLATAQATLAAAGGSLPVTAGSPTGPAPTPLTCTDPSAKVASADSAEAASSYLTAQLNATGQHLMLAMPGATPTPDFNATSWAALSLVRAGHPQQAAGAVDWLANAAGSWAHGPAGTDPGATATLLLVAQAVGHNPHAFGGTNLVQQLIDAGPAPKPAPSKKNGGLSPLWMAGVGLIAGVGGGLYISLNRKRGQVAGK